MQRGGFARRRLGLVALTLSLAASCEKREPTAQSSSPSLAAALDAAASAPVATATSSSVSSSARADAAVDAGPLLEFVGVLRGKVKLKSGAQLPIAGPVMGGDGKPPVVVVPCPAVDVHDRRTVAAHDKTGGLYPVHVAVTGMSAAPTREPRVHELFIDGCRLRPTLLGALRGDKVRITNRTDLALLPALPGDKFMQAMMRGETREFPVTRLGPTEIQCGFSTYCGASSIITLSHPLFAVTDREGAFTIENVPLDESLTVHAWHPLFEVTSEPFTLTREQREKSFDLALVPTPGAATAERPEKAAGASDKASPKKRGATSGADRGASGKPDAPVSKP